MDKIFILNSWDKKETIFDYSNVDLTVNELKDNISIILWNNEIKTRVYFIRHWESIDDNELLNWEKKPQSPHSGLSDNWRKQIEISTNQIEKFWLNNSNTLFIYSDDTSRVIESLDIILNIFWISSVINDDKLKTSQKYLWDDGKISYYKDRKRLLIDLWISVSSIELMDEILSEDIYKSFKNIVLIWHKSNKSGITESVYNKDLPFRWDLQINNWEILEFDISSENEYINHKDSNLLFVNSLSYDKLLNIFPDVSHSTIIEFQNKLNAMFIKYPELFNKYVLSENSDLRKFCLINLIKNKEIFLLNKLFLDEKFLSEVNKIDFSDLDLKEKTIFNYYLNVYFNVIEVRKKSLDYQIKNWENKELDFNFNSELYNNILNLVNNWSNIKYIEWKAWAWKSFLLSKISEQLNYENIYNNKLEKLYYPVYINLSWNWIDVLNNIQNLCDYKNYQAIYLLDSIDESYITWEDRRKLDNKLLELSRIWKVIITCRNGYNYNYDNNNDFDKKQIELLLNNSEKIELTDFSEENINKYLYKYFTNNSDKIEEVKKILIVLKWAWNNPLILSMICQIVESWWLKDIELSKLTIIDIYSEIVSLRLINWNNNHDARKLDLSTDDLNDRISLLWEISYKSLLNWKQSINYQDIIKTWKIKWSEFSKNHYLDSLNLLFRKNSNWEFDFIHQSIKEFFAAKHVYKLMLEDKNFDYEKFLCQDLKKVDINFVSLFCEIVINDIKLKKKFLKKINENESYFSEDLHYKIIFILWNIDSKSKKQYLKYIDLESDFDVLEEITGDIESIKSTLYWNDIITIDFYNKLLLWNTIWDINIELAKKNFHYSEITDIKFNIKKNYTWNNFTLKLLFQLYNNNNNKLKFLINLEIQAYWEIWNKLNDNDKEYIKNLINIDNYDIKKSVIYAIKNIWWIDNQIFLEYFSNNIINDIDNKYENNLLNIIDNKQLELLCIIWWNENITFLKHLIENIDFIWKNNLLVFLIENSIDIWLEYYYSLINKWIDIPFWSYINKLLYSWWSNNLDLITKLYKSFKPSHLDIENINQIWNKEFIPLLKESINTDDDYIKLKSLESIYELWWNDEIEYIKKFASDDDKNVREIVNIILKYDSLKNDAETAKYNLINWIGDAYTFEKTIHILWNIWWKEYVEIIREMLRKKDKHIVSNAIDELKYIWWKENLELVKKYSKKLK